MPEKITIREMLEIATNIQTGKGHYILKVAVKGKTITEGAETLCGLISPERVHKVLHLTTPATMDCVRCGRMLAKHEEVNKAKRNLKEVKMFETSDGKVFPLKAREAALKHENELTTVRKEKEFIADVKRVLFTNGDTFDEDMIAAFESDLDDAMSDYTTLEMSGDISLKEFLGVFHEMLVKHGAKIRQMIILYQQIYGTLVPCRTTMEKMKDAGIYL